MGANIGTDEWTLAKAKKNAAAEFADKIRITHQNVAAKRGPPKEKPRELNKREKALAYANAVPRPRPS